MKKQNETNAAEIFDVESWLEQKENEIRKELEEVEDLEDQANEALGKAVRLLDEAGIGYSFSISPLAQRYIAAEGSPRMKSLKAEIVGKINDETGKEISEKDAEVIIQENLYSYFGRHEWGDTGWEHSAVC